MNTTQLMTRRVDRMIDTDHRLEIQYMPEGVTVEGGRTYHLLSQVCDDGTVNHLARVDAMVITRNEEAVLMWYINAPAYEYQMPDTWMAVRAWDNDSDAVLALWRLRRLARSGSLPRDLRDAI